MNSSAPAGSAAARLIDDFGLALHPEGGYFKETYRSAARLPGGTLAQFTAERSLSTAILFLLPRGATSRLHRLRSDEMWHFHLGGPLHVVSIAPDGRVERVALGAGAGQKLQHVVPAGRWFGAYPDPAAEFALAGCTVAPGFDFADFELGRRGELLRLFPGSREIVDRLTEPDHG